MATNTVVKEVLLTREQIAARVSELAEQISSDYAGRQLLLVTVLKGAFVFAADLQRELWNHGLQDTQNKFLGVSSYGMNQYSSGDPKIHYGEHVNIEGFHVLFIEDIVDTGFTVSALLDYFADKGALSIEVATLLSKPGKRKVTVPVKYVGFDIPTDAWVEGYGIDTAQEGRGNPDIVVVKK